MSLSWITAPITGFKIVSRLRRVIREGRDIPKAYRQLEAKYSELPDDVKGAWTEVAQFVDAFLDLFPQTRD